MSGAKAKRRTVPDHARAAIGAIDTVLEGKPLTVPHADLEAAKKWLAAKLQPGGAWPKGDGKRRSS